MIAKVAECPTMETVLGNNDIVDLRGRKHSQELVVIGLENTVLLEFEGIALLHSLFTTGLVGRFVSA